MTSSISGPLVTLMRARDVPRQSSTLIRIPCARMVGHPQGKGQVYPPPSCFPLKAQVFTQPSFIHSNQYFDLLSYLFDPRNNFSSKNLWIRNVEMCFNRWLVLILDVTSTRSSLPDIDREVNLETIQYISRPMYIFLNQDSKLVAQNLRQL